MRTVIVLVGAVMIACASLWAAENQPTGATEVERLERAWSAAFLKHDVATISSILADDYVGIDGRGVVTSKSDEIDEAKAPAPNAPSVAYRILSEELSAVRVRVFGGAAGSTRLASQTAAKTQACGTAARRCMSAGTDVGSACPFMAAAHGAAQFLQPDAVDLFVRAGADPNRTDSGRRTPLHELGAGVSAVDAGGRTPLFHAAAFARAEVVSLLLAAGADVHHRDARGLTALGAMRYTTPTLPDAPKVVAILKAAGAIELAQLPDASRDTVPPLNADLVAATLPGSIDEDPRAFRHPGHAPILAMVLIKELGVMAQ